MNDFDIRKEIISAVGSHAKWKLRLRQAAIFGETGISVDEISCHDSCTLGVWLKKLETRIQNPGDLAQVNKLHTDLHHLAGNMAQRINAGDGSDVAAELIEGPFVDLSNALKKAIMNLRAIKQV